jgi:catechol 2,3-dioxygenase-like lactoylglutathione lyase family enzyme
MPKKTPAKRTPKAARPSTTSIDADIAFDRVVPILRIFDVAKAKDFYVGYLGFRVVFERRSEGAAPLYLEIARGGFVLHLTEHHGDCCPGAKVFVRMTGLDAFHAELQAKRYGYLNPGLEDTGMGFRELETIDPFGNRICFAESNGPLVAAV